MPKRAKQGYGQGSMRLQPTYLRKNGQIVKDAEGKAVLLPKKEWILRGYRWHLIEDTDEHLTRVPGSGKTKAEFELAVLKNLKEMRRKALSKDQDLPSSTPVAQEESDPIQAGPVEEPIQLADVQDGGDEVLKDSGFIEDWIFGPMSSDRDMETDLSLVNVLDGAFEAKREVEVEQAPPEPITREEEEFEESVRLAGLIKKMLSRKTAAFHSENIASLIRQSRPALFQRYSDADELLLTARTLLNDDDDSKAEQFIFAVERGQATLDRNCQPYADAFRAILEEKRDQIRGLGEGKLAHYYQNYFCRLWDSPEAGRRLIDRLYVNRLREHRTQLWQQIFPLLSDGFEVGIHPRFKNPIGALVEQLFQMDCFILSQSLIRHLHKDKRIRYVAEGRSGPPGYVRVDDRLFDRFPEGEVRIYESPDEELASGLRRLARELGSVWSRLGGGAETQSESDDFFLEPLIQEIASGIDRKFGFREWATFLENNHELRREMKRLAEFRKDKPAVAAADGSAASKTALIQNLLFVYLFAPALLESEAPKLAKLFELFIEDHAPLRQIRKLKPSIKVIGRYEVPADLGVFVNHYFDPGRLGVVHEIWESRGDANDPKSRFTLAFSGLHARAMSFHSLNERAKEFNGGEFLGVATELGLIPQGGPPQGGLPEGGGKEFYHQAVKSLRAAWGRANVGESAAKTAMAIFEGSEGSVTSFVPLIKLAAFSKLWEHEGDETDLAAIGTKSWNELEKRFAQLLLNDSFWVSASQAVVRVSIASVGATVGPRKGTGIHKSLSDRIVNAMAPALVVGICGATLDYLLVGKSLVNTADSFFPRTGQVNSDGSLERLDILSYLEDLYGFVPAVEEPKTRSVMAFIGLSQNLNAKHEREGLSALKGV